MKILLRVTAMAAVAIGLSGCRLKVCCGVVNRGFASGGPVPDLRYVSKVVHDNWQNVVIGGTYSGMAWRPSWTI